MTVLIEMCLIRKRSKNTISLSQQKYKCQVLRKSLPTQVDAMRNRSNTIDSTMIRYSHSKGNVNNRHHIWLWESKITSFHSNLLI